MGNCGCSNSSKKVAPKQQARKRASASTASANRVGEIKRIIRRPVR